VFGDVIGISLGVSCLFRLRRRAEASWQRASLRLEPRSAYLLQGLARTEWEHSISRTEGLVLALVLGFGSSEALANAYGIAVAGDMMVTTLLMAVMAHGHWRLSWPLVVAVAGPFLVLNLLFVTGNLQRSLPGADSPCWSALWRLA
jgi:hypothetical protein